MDSWRDHMPKGMMLKSDGFASNIYTPDGTLTIEQFCAERGIPYHHTEIPVSLATFSEYGVTFRNRLLPELEEKNVVGIVQHPQSFVLTLDTGEEVRARHVVLAVGITHFQHIPAPFSQLGPAHVSHSYQHHDLEPFRGRDVVVVGGGASAIELSGLLHEAGANVQLVARRKELVFHNPPPIGKRRSVWQRIRNPQSGLGPGLKSRFFANSPELFRRLPETTRLEFVRTALGPSAGWTSRKQVVGKVPLLLGMTPLSAGVVDGKVRLRLRSADGSERDLVADHVITGTGYKVDLDRLQFLSPEIRQQIAVVNGSPALSATFESSVPGLYFIGLAAANTFGPVMRFAFGAGFAARCVAKAMKALRSRQPAAVPAIHAVNTAKNESSSAL
jgi:cation diffusion facilitator CzcD-associated flavoprotein CzcO